MLKKEDNELLTRTEAGTPMGELFRRFWIPACLSEEVPEPDSPPIRVRLLGEDLVAFRDTNGKVGLVDYYCPHRGASLFFGRNEECGIRCAYHGWKFDVDGNCVDMPNEPPQSNFKHKVALPAYPTWEGGGMIWTYMGPSEEQPPFPDYEFVRVPHTHYHVSKTLQETNWLQGLEGGIDTSHSSFAHNDNIADKKQLRSRDPHPKLEVIKTAYGLCYSGIRDMGDGERSYVRVVQYIVPFHQMRGTVTDWFNGSIRKIPTLNGHMWIPIDDENCYVYNWMYTVDETTPMTEEFVLEYEYWMGRGPDDMIRDSGYKLKRNKDNDYLIDRQLQKTKTFTGIKGINTQDQAIQSSMGPIVNRSKEHLGTADSAIIAARHLLKEALNNMKEGKPIRGHHPDTHSTPRACDYIIPQGVDWKEYLKDDMKAKW